jgi:OOP family OmpA-OmpF porin
MDFAMTNLIQTPNLKTKPSRTDPMKILQLTFTCALLLLSFGLFSQGTPVPATNDTETVETTDATIEDLTGEDAAMDDGEKTGTMWEFGIRPSYMWIGGDVDAGSDFGIGIHFRKSLDHLFSLRFDGLYGNSNGENENMTRRFENNFISGTGFVVVSLNNFRFKGDTRKTNIYAMVGAGANFFETEYQDPGSTWQEGRNPVLEREFAPHAAGGAGIAFRLSPRVNLGFEYQAIVPFGSRADQLDGYNEVTDPSLGGNFRDIQNVGSISLNFNLGNRAKKAEPMYWTNAFSPIKDEISRVDARVDDATRDSDGDGVVDAIDQEANTPAGVPVDTKGRVLDSDKDGVPDYKDLEPFFPPRAGEQVDANGVVINRNDKPITEDRVQEMIDASIARMQDGNQGGTTRVQTDRGEVYLPMIYFPLNGSTIKYSDYGTLSSVARVLQGNPDMKMVIRGYTDRVGSAANNEVLSYRRAKAVVDHLVTQHGIERSRLVLQYRGEQDAIVPLDKSYVNRRVEFQTAADDATEDAAPAGAGSGRGY